MTTIECPWCAGPASVDAALTSVDCDCCGTTAEIAPDPILTLDAAA